LEIQVEVRSKDNDKKQPPTAQDRRPACLWLDFGIQLWLFAWRVRFTLFLGSLVVQTLQIQSSESESQLSTSNFLVSIIGFRLSTPQRDVA